MMASIANYLAIFLCFGGIYWFGTCFFLSKRSFSTHSSCDEGEELLKFLGLTDDEIARTQAYRSTSQGQRKGCWMERTADSIVILLVDALRFDFAYYNLPLSIGRRIHEMNETRQSRLYQFLADPPTVTMQRLKGLTTGGLPTFADISSNFGGATVDEDSWVSQINIVDPQKRSRASAHMAFVGDDTWEDLFPGKFRESHPYPSFNTRDLETVDNGCLAHLPRLLNDTLHQEDTENSFEVLVVHFLGVDHVGHTYGPHNEHMATKLHQMDTILANVLDQIDESPHCHQIYVFGDHGMTHDGNHGGGTDEETHAALFAHSSRSCVQDVKATDEMASILLDGPTTSSDLVREAAFTSLHQIDLVATMSLVLGLPIPYANVGSLVPFLLTPNVDIRQTSTALALNAAQVWRYFKLYSSTANSLPRMDELATKLEVATDTFQQALHNQDDKAKVADIDGYTRAASLYKLFLRDALELAQAVWTRFDMTGMATGISAMGFGLLLFVYTAFQESSSYAKHEESITLPPKSQYWEVGASMMLMLYHCGLLQFGNSYILEEQHSFLYAIVVISLMLSFRLWSEQPNAHLWLVVLIIPVSARFHETLVFGHGLDPSIGVHYAHHPGVFGGSVSVLVLFRWLLYRVKVTQSMLHAIVDSAALACLVGSWWERKSDDSDQEGFILCQISLALTTGSLLVSLLGPSATGQDSGIQNNTNESDLVTGVFKLLVATISVTGPSAAASSCFYVAQCTAVYIFAKERRIQSLVVASLWKMLTRHAFFTTNHGCAFNRLQYSAAFVATKEFNFVTGGMSLFCNTFGWEVAGLIGAHALSRQKDRESVWTLYIGLQLFEALASCISVTVLRRHLMVWDIYAPHFLFVAIFTILAILSCLTKLILPSSSQ